MSKSIATVAGVSVVCAIVLGAAIFTAVQLHGADKPAVTPATKPAATPSTKPAAAPSTQPATVDPTPVNTKCPVTGEDIDSKVTTVHDGKTYAFCCADCVKAFKKNPDKYTSGK